MTRPEAVSGSPTVARPDPQYAFVGGLYLAALLTPAAILVASIVVQNAAALYVGFLGVWAAVTVLAGWGISRTRGFAVRLGRSDASWLFVVVPFVVFGGAFVTLGFGERVPRTVVPLAMVTMITGVLFGLPFVVMSRTRHADDASAGATEFARWEARWPPRWRRLAVGAMLLGLASALVAVVAQVVSRAGWADSAYLIAFLWTPLASAATPRTFRVTDAGVVVERPLHRRLLPWDAFEGYSVTDDALVLVPTAWWRPKLRSDRADVEGLDAVVSALDGTLGSGPS
ncbi:hypothetical protein [Salinigranum marinum]|uniref:hypothetical protein n=1 Tax=Salinigranum marinum TaxID=1515595 RepID=UPI002989E777|nr:hypothetical protein [Salinigranum marinum]